MSTLDPMQRQRQVDATRNRPLRTLPTSWWQQDVAEAMCDWITRFVPAHLRRGFTYGQRS